jgi:hypothetical protein
VDAVEGHPCGQFSYPTLQYVPEDGRIFVAYTVLFLPSAMSPDCKVSGADTIAVCSTVHHAQSHFYEMTHEQPRSHLAWSEMLSVSRCLAVCSNGMARRRRTRRSACPPAACASMRPLRPF